MGEKRLVTTPAITELVRLILIGGGFVFVAVPFQSLLMLEDPSFLPS
jgi:hypothetical protein